MSANPVIHWSDRPDPGFMNENFTRSEMKNYGVITPSFIVECYKISHSVYNKSYINKKMRFSSCICHKPINNKSSLRAEYIGNFVNKD